MAHALPAGFVPNEHEKELIEAVSAGRAWQGNKGCPEPEQLKDAKLVEGMPKIHAKVIRALCLGYRLNDAPVDPVGIDIYGARIDGKLDLSFANVPVQLSLYHCHIAECPNLMQAHFPSLGLSGSRLEKGLAADGLKVDGALFCRNGFHATGEVRLLGATIGGLADFCGATLTHANGTALTHANGAALSADGIRVTGDLFCHDGFSAIGEVRLLGATIGGDVSFDGATLVNANGKALNADGISVTGSLFCRKGFKITGRADFTASRIEKWLHWEPSEWNGLLDLSHAFAGQWKDNWTGNGWAAEGKPQIDLKTFTYDALATNNSHNDAESRIRWIRRSLKEGDFAPGPFETLARVLRASGDDGGANDVAYAKRVDRAKHRAKPLLIYFGSKSLWRRTDDFLLDILVGHGHKPWRGFGWLVGLLLFGWLFFAVNGPMAPNGWGNGVIKPAVPVIFGSVLALERCGDDVKAPDGKCPAQIAYNDSPSSHVIHYTLPIEYTPFSPFWYALDTLIPLVDLGQESAWSPSPISSSIFEDFGGWFVLGYLYVHIIVGWIFTTLTVVALSGVIKKD